MPTAGEVAVACLVDGGVRWFAGMVGSVTVPLVAAVAREPRARFVAVRHEQVAAALLDATARLTGIPGVCLVHSASGSLAASLGIASAQRDCVPLVLISGTQERAMYRRGAWQVLDIDAVLRPIVKWQQRVEDPAEIPAAIRRALAEATGGRPGVVHLDLPIDISQAPLDAAPAADRVYRAPLYRPEPDSEAVRQTLNLLRRARRPVLVCGGGAAWSRAGEAVTALAEHLGAPVVLSASSRGLVPEDHPLCLGSSGVIGYPAASRALREADLIVGLGARFSDLQTSRWQHIQPGVPIVQCDLDAAEIGQQYPVTVGVLADVRAFVDQLLIGAEHGLPVDDGQGGLRAEPLAPDPDRQAWAAGLRAEREVYLQDWLATTPGDGQAPRPQEVIGALIEQLPRDAILAAGAGDHGFFAALLPIHVPYGQLTSVRLGAMGCGLGLALGAKLAAPERQVVAILGDGELMIQLQDLETMVREGLAVTVIVFNNFQLGSQRPRMAATGIIAGVEHTNPDFAQLARLFGAQGWRVDRPGQFPAALQAALASNGPALIDVLLDPTITAPRP